MSEKPSIPAAGDAAGTGSVPSVGTGPSSGVAGDAGAKIPADATKKVASDGNPAFRAMGLPRLRLPSRNWLIFWSVIGSFAGAVAYDKYQTRRNRQKWCDLVSHIAQQPLETHSLPRRVTVYLAAPPGDGLRSAREHFHEYVKPVLVAAAMDWDVVEGRKEGDVRFKTAERIRRKRKRAGEGDGVVEDGESEYSVASVRAKNGTREEEGVAGDIVIGRHTWKEYVRGQHEGWLGPVAAPALPEDVSLEVPKEVQHIDGTPSVGDAAVKAAANVANPQAPQAEQLLTDSQQSETTSEDKTLQDGKPAEEKEEEEQEEKPKPRHPPPYIWPSEYSSATLSPNAPELVGPVQPVFFPHLLGFRNTPVRIYRFLNRRRLADTIGRDVATAVLASHYRSFSSSTIVDNSSASSEGVEAPEQSSVMASEEADWWKKNVYRERKEHEESVWIEPVVVDERLSARMKRFELMSEDEDRAKRLGDGREKVVKPGEEES